MSDLDPTPQQRRNYYFIILSVISMQITASTIYMVFPLFFASVGLNKAESGLLISIGTFAGILSSVAAGLLSNKYGRKNILFAGTVLYTLVFFLFAYEGSGFGVLMVLRFIEGIGFYIMPVMVTTMAADIFPTRERGKAMSLYSVSGGIGSLIGPLIAPLLIRGNDYTFYFLFSGGFVAVSVIMMFFFVKETVSKEKLAKEMAAPKTRFSVSGFLRSVRGLGLVVGIFLLAIFIYRTGYTMFDPFLSLYLKDVVKMDLSLTSYIYAARALCIIAFSPLAGMLIDRSGRKNAIVLGLAMSVVTMIGYSFVTDFFGMVLLRSFDGITWAVMLTAMNTLMADLLSPEMRGFGLGLQSSITQQSSTIGSLFS
ncbi:MAG: MFS transporter, partial [Candidatus Bathyarchaeota archaeon]|nr:MFS transporter [Candidatus Bathyarchaeota archaeon]